MIQLLDNGLIACVVAGAERSARKRLNHNFHAGDADNPHKFLNVLLEGTYIAPHRHRQPPKSEMFVALEGGVGVVVFDDAGRVLETHILRARGPARGVDIAAGVWHTVVVFESPAVCLEIKPGPWDPATDKEFAPWAPREGDPAAEAYLRALLAELG